MPSSDGQPSVSFDLERERVACVVMGAPYGEESVGSGVVSVAAYEEEWEPVKPHK